MTMIELLIVVAVMVILMGIALPVMKTGIEGRRIREAARQLSTMAELAKSQAAGSDRPVALWLDTQILPETNAASPLHPFSVVGQVYLAETPLPYAGDVIHAKCFVGGTVVRNNPAYGYDAVYGQLTFSNPGLGVNPTESLGVGALGIEEGDMIRFDFKGPLYRIEDWDPNTTYKVPGPAAVIPIVNATFDKAPPQFVGGQLFDPKLPPQGVYQYQIFRKPQKSGTAAMQLPSGIVVDLKHSGFSTSGQNFTSTTQPILVVFGKSGAVERMLSGGTWVVPTDTVHFLIGRVEQVGAEGKNSPLPSVVPNVDIHFNENLEDPANLWVSIGHHTGRVTTAENGWSVRATFEESLTDAREFAQSGQSIGGR